MITTTTKKYRYEITVSGDGGEFSFIPMNPEQMVHWNEKGTDALVEHVTGGCEEDGTPPQFNLGFHYDHEASTWGIASNSESELLVRAEDGEICFQKFVYDLDDQIQIRRVVERPSTGAFFRTFEKGPLTYKLELAEPFDPANLRLCATETPEGDPINGVIYAGEEALQVNDMKPCWSRGEAELFG